MYAKRKKVGADGKMPRSLLDYHIGKSDDSRCRSIPFRLSFPAIVSRLPEKKNKMVGGFAGKSSSLDGG